MKPARASGFRSALFCTLVALCGCGTTKHLVNEDYAIDESAPKLGAPNPAERGEHEFKTYVYGSGTDKRRDEYAEGVDFKTESVDASKLVKFEKKRKAKKRKRYWGFGPDAYPVNGRVWFPEGSGPFPLVLIVHGNHDMKDYSDPGYAYLGELLASRGYILVSVDENFLNGDISGENDARGWMLLQHLKVWRDWNADPDHPFHGKVDMNNIALIGHSRGGECVAHAAAFNRLDYYPDDAREEFDFNFAIKTLIALAPVDQQYKPTGRPTPLENVNYLVLHGGHDADVAIFMGQRQYQRVKLTEAPWIKASLWAYRANHSRFNTEWGLRNASLWPIGWLINIKPVLAPEEQRRIAEVYISAFLDATIRGRRDYLPMFRDADLVRDWIPETIYVTRFESGGQRIVADYEDDIDLTTASYRGGELKGEGFSIWKEARLKMRDMSDHSLENNAVILGWTGNIGAADEDETREPATYSVALPAGAAKQLKLDNESALIFSAGTPEASPFRDDSKREEPKTRAEKRKQRREAKVRKKTIEEYREEYKDKPVDFTVEFISSSGESAAVAVSDFGLVHPPLPAQVAKLKFIQKKFMDDGKMSDRLLQDIQIPLEAFSDANPKLNLSELDEIRFRFDRTPAGAVYLDDIGFAN